MNNLTASSFSFQRFLKCQSVRNCSTKCLTTLSSTPQISPSLCNYIIRASIEKGSPQKALLDYKTILLSGTIRPDHRTLSSVLEACKISKDFGTAVGIHTGVIKSGFVLYPSLLASLVSIYVASDCLGHALLLLDEIPRWGFNIVSANLVIAGYMKIGEFDNAKRVFHKMPHRDLVSWNSMIAGCVRNTRFKESMSFFRKMLSLNFEPDGFTFASVITGCARIGALVHGEWVHGLMIDQGIELNFILSSALIDMYSKCGRIKTAKGLFDKVRRDDVSVWNAMITGLAIHGLALDAMALFLQMDRESVSPDTITFIGILTACSHCGLVAEGCHYFDLMRKHYLIEPQLEHYGAMVDLFARAGLLEEAYGVIKAMTVEPDAVIWKALLSACRTHKKPDLGAVAINQIALLDSGDYVLLSNMYCSVKRWDSAERVREVMKRKGVLKNCGMSWVELGGDIHQFKAGDRSHPDTNVIYRVLEGLMQRIKMDGFVPATELVLMDVSEEEKEGNLNCHSEKLAATYGILKTSPRTEIRVSKNLRTCHDCHCWMKLVSKVLNRVIIVRDRIRFHRFTIMSASRLVIPSKRAFAYFVLTGGRFVYASLIRLLVLKFVLSKSPSKDVLGLASLEVDLSSIEPGTNVTVKWHGKPVFMRRRTEDDIKLANSVDVRSLRDPQEDSARV
ncbi:hypothetical protein HHK36_012057 [Tetracentron sinense]|uniref:Uncharacterized protein n=1 Tax=Tetracentron sinense TaxID=13715 RepID=A0A834ZE84_TETSI|nr:hypothetical protein HHK36_012057 [Tetracentron sinense]